ncbi:hypothetical protein [Sulfitobacter sp. 1A13679]|uniref:hypothetical protein n=1 Tax=Sulfitobacter sp. 1A13679 TaxID=3368597 RepID=UPI0037494188
MPPDQWEPVGEASSITAAARADLAALTPKYLMRFVWHPLFERGLLGTIDHIVEIIHGETEQQHCVDQTKSTYCWQRLAAN